MRCRRRTNLRTARNRQMRSYKGRNFRDAPMIDISSLDQSFQQSYEFSPTEAYLMEDRFDD